MQGDDVVIKVIVPLVAACRRGYCRTSQLLPQQDCNAGQRIKDKSRDRQVARRNSTARMKDQRRDRGSGNHNNTLNFNGWHTLGKTLQAKSFQVSALLFFSTILIIFCFVSL